MLRRLILCLLFLLLATGGGAYWLLTSQGGLDLALRLAGTLSGGRLQAEHAEGQLGEHLRVGELRWQDGTTRVSARQLELTWRPRALFERRLQIEDLSIASLQIDTAADDTPASQPETLQLPLALQVAALRLESLQLGEREIARQLSLRIDSDGHQHRIEQIRLSAAEVAVSGQLQLDGTAPFPLQLDAELRGQLEARPLALKLSASGPLAELAVKLHALAGIDGSADLRLTPFAAMPFAEADIRLTGIDPAAWHPQLPAARIDLNIQVKPQGEGVSAHFELNNQRPTPLDQGGLPLAALRGDFVWQPGRLDFPTLHARLSGGELSGHGRWQGELANGALALELAVRQLDAQRVHGSLRPTQLNGQLSARLAQAAQEVRIDLRDRRFTLLGTVGHAADTLTLEQIEISAAQARLLADGSLQLGERRFRGEARLRDFDPSRFAELPTARINADLQASGELRAAPRAELSFAIADSRVRDQPLAGEGRLTLAWPTLPAVDVKLRLGDNRIAAQGAFGQPGQRLAVDIDAPQLAALGGEGELKGRLTLAGSLARPQLDGELKSARLGLPGVFRLHELRLEARLAEDADAPLRIDLDLGRLESGSGERLLAPLQLRGEGSRRQHRLQLNGTLGSGERLQLRLAGSEQDERWQGSLEQLELRADSAARNLRLRAPAALRAAADGWSVGPLQLAGDPLDWHATLQLAADRQALKLDLEAAGSRIGRVQAKLAAAMDGPWQLASNTPWQGTATAAVDDLGWLGDVLGEGWQTGGRLDARLQLAGSPARPLLGGRIDGSGLSLRLAPQGLALVDGELQAELTDNLLSIRRLDFNSLRQRAPRPLRLALDDAAASLEGPGRLSIAGELRVGADQPAGQAALSIKLDRVGVWQRDDQWVSLSGTGKLRWQQAALGIDGQLAVDAAYWQLAPAGAPRLSDDVVVHRPGNKPAQGLRPKLELDLNTELGRFFLFEGAGLSTRLAGQVRLSASGRDLPRASGTIRTRDGRFEAYGQRLEISRGILTFQGLPDNPALDVRAVRKGLPVEPGVQLSGTAQRPVLRLVSEPEMSDAEKLSWLILGHGQDSMGAGDASLLLSAASGLLGNDAGGLVQQLKRTFGIDEFGVRQGNLDGSGGRQPGSRVVAGSLDTTASTGNQILSIGKRLSSSATLSYEHALGTAESIVKLSVELTRQLTLVGRAGSDNAVDLFYTLTWGRPPRRGAPAP